MRYCDSDCKALPFEDTEEEETNKERIYMYNNRMVSSYYDLKCRPTNNITNHYLQCIVSFWCYFYLTITIPTIHTFSLLPVPINTLNNEGVVVKRQHHQKLFVESELSYNDTNTNNYNNNILTKSSSSSSLSSKQSRFRREWTNENYKTNHQTVGEGLPLLSSISRRDIIVAASYFTANMLILLDSHMSEDANAEQQQQQQAPPPTFLQRVRAGSSSSSRGTAGGGGTNIYNNDLYAITPDNDATVGRGLIAAKPQLLTSELCLLRLLPVSKKIFLREIQTKIEAISNLKQSIITSSSSSLTSLTTTTNTDQSIVVTLWDKTYNDTIIAINELDRKRSQLEPVFIQDDSTSMQIAKNERFEILIETLRSHLVHISHATKEKNLYNTLQLQKLALLTLSEIGELLVPVFPYKVPTEGKYSYLPRLLGRAKVTFTIRRSRTIVGNITIVADGYTAPITAGNFIDLCERQFYTGLSIKFSKKRIGSLLGSDFDILNLPILGSYNEGFYDPLTGKLRRLPLELIRVENGSSEQDLTYTQGLSSLTKSTSDAILEPTDNSKPLLSFRIPGMVAMNHPDRNLNGASSEFFALQQQIDYYGSSPSSSSSSSSNNNNNVADETTASSTSLSSSLSSSSSSKRYKLLDGEYAPFGFIIDGLEFYNTIQPNDIIEKTTVDEWGLRYLVKLRKSSFTEVVKGSDAETI